MPRLRIFGFEAIGEQHDDLGVEFTRARAVGVEQSPVTGDRVPNALLVDDEPRAIHAPRQAVDGSGRDGQLVRGTRHVGCLQCDRATNSSGALPRDAFGSCSAENVSPINETGEHNRAIRYTVSPPETDTPALRNSFSTSFPHTEFPVMRQFVAVFVLLLVGACAGKDGATGLTGPQGPQGPAGPGTRLVLTATVGSSGGASVALPAAAGTLANPPALACYYSSPGSTVLVAVASTASTSYPFCGLVQTTGSTSLTASMSGVASGYTAVFVVVY